MDKFTNTINELTTIFNNNANSTTKIKQEKFLVNNFLFYGILTSKRKSLVKPVITNCNKILTLQEKKNLFEEMYKQPNREWQYTAKVKSRILCKFIFTEQYFSYQINLV